MFELTLDEAQLIEFAKTVELSASKVLEGVHRSARGGDGLEFHSATPYSQGDDVRRIDWKRLAASDRVYIRKFQREEKSDWQIFIDRSESMTYGKKFLSAAHWAASFSLLCEVWGDRCELWPQERVSHQELLPQLTSGKLGFDFESWGGATPRRGARLLLLSDFFFDLDSMSSWIETHREQFYSIHLVQILDRRESQFSFDDVLRFEDPESPERLTLDANVVRERYLRELTSQQEALKKLTRDRDSFLNVVESTEAMEDYLLQFFVDLEDRK